MNTVKPQGNKPLLSTYLHAEWTLTARGTMNEQGILYNITIYCTDLELHLWQTENARLKLTISQIRN